MGVAIGVQAHVGRVVAEEEEGDGEADGEDDAPGEEPAHLPAELADEVGEKGNDSQPTKGGTAGADAEGGGATAPEPAGEEGAGGVDGASAHAHRGYDAEHQDQIDDVGGHEQEQGGCTEDDQAGEDDDTASEAVEKAAHEGLEQTVQEHADGSSDGDGREVPVEGFLHGRDEGTEALPGAHGDHGQEETGGYEHPPIEEGAALGLEPMVEWEGSA